MRGLSDARRAYSRVSSTRCSGRPIPSRGSNPASADVKEGNERWSRSSGRTLSSFSSKLSARKPGRAHRPPAALRAAHGRWLEQQPHRGAVELRRGRSGLPRMTDPFFRTAEAGTSFAQTSGDVVDLRPRTISNLIVDQTATNPSAVAVAGGVTPDSRRNSFHPQYDAGWRRFGLIQLLVHAVRPVLRSWARSRQQGRQRHGLHPAPA